VEAHILPVNQFFLIDVERFEDDEYEPMSTKGMGALYTHDTQGIRFSATLTGPEGDNLLDKYYRPHHAQLNLLAH
jgi:N-formylglutamate deformylase